MYKRRISACRFSARLKKVDSVKYLHDVPSLLVRPSARSVALSCDRRRNGLPFPHESAGGPAKADTHHTLQVERRFVVIRQTSVCPMSVGIPVFSCEEGPALDRNTYAAVPAIVVS